MHMCVCVWSSMWLGAGPAGRKLTAPQIGADFPVDEDRCFHTRQLMLLSFNLFYLFFFFFLPRLYSRFPWYNAIFISSDLLKCLSSPTAPIFQPPFLFLYRVFPYLSNFLGYSQKCHFIFLALFPTPCIFFGDILLIRSALAVQSLLSSLVCSYFLLLLQNFLQLQPSGQLLFFLHSSHLP